mgnify:CR=1 FL=1
MADLHDLSLAEIAARLGDIMAGSAEGVSIHNESDPREWSPKPYKVVIG